MIHYSALLNRGKSLVIKEDWIQNPELLSISTIFYSPVKTARANFNLPISSDFESEKTACYTAYLIEKFESKPEEKRFVEMESGPSKNKEETQTPVRHSPINMTNSKAASGLRQLNMAVDQSNPNVDRFINKFARSQATQLNSNYYQVSKTEPSTSEQNCDNKRNIEAQSWEIVKTITQSVSKQSDLAVSQPIRKIGGLLSKHTVNRANKSTYAKIYLCNAQTMPKKMLNDDIGTDKRSSVNVTNNLTDLQQLNNAAFQPYAICDFSSECAQYPKNGSTKSKQICDNKRRIEMRTWVNAKGNTLSVSEQSDLAVIQPIPKIDDFSSTKYQLRDMQTMSVFVSKDHDGTRKRSWAAANPDTLTSDVKSIDDISSKIAHEPTKKRKDSKSTESIGDLQSVSLPFFNDCRIETHSSFRKKTNTPSIRQPTMVNMSPIQLESKHMEALGEFGDSEDEDQAFVFYLLEAIFEREELQNGSYGGTRSNNNGASHEQLDPTKISFIQGLFESRVDEDNNRLKKLPAIVNKKCNYLRRSLRGKN